MDLVYSFKSSLRYRFDFEKWTEGGRCRRSNLEILVAYWMLYKWRKKNHWATWHFDEKSHFKLDFEGSPFFLRDSRASETRVRVKITPRVSPFLREVIFTRAHVSLAQLSLRKNGDYSYSYFKHDAVFHTS